MSLARLAAVRLAWAGASLILLTLLFGVISLIEDGLQQSTRQLKALREAEDTLATIAAQESGNVQPRLRQLQLKGIEPLRTKASEIDQTLAQHAGIVPVSALPSHKLVCLLRPASWSRAFVAN